MLILKQVTSTVPRLPFNVTPKKVAILLIWASIIFYYKNIYSCNVNFSVFKGVKGQILP